MRPREEVRVSNEVIQLARRGEAVTEAYPERRVVGRLPLLPWRARVGRGAAKLAIAAALAGAAAWTLRRRWRFA